MRSVPSLQSLLFCAAALSLAALPATARAQTPTPTPPPFASDARPLLVAPESAADPQGADAIVFNPAGLAVDPTGEAVFIHADRPQANLPGDGDALYLKSSPLLNVGMEWARPAKNVDAPIFTFAAPIELTEGLSAGASLTTTMGKTFTPYSFQSWNVGALGRPGRWISVGGMIWNAAHTPAPAGLDLRARYDGALAIRPLTDLLTLSVDVLKTDGQKGEELRYGVRTEPVRGLSLYGTANKEKQYTVGLVFSFAHAGAGTDGFGEEGKYAGTSTRVRTRERRQPTVAKIRPTFVKMTIGGSLPDQSKATLLSPGSQTLPGVLRELEQVRKDPGVDGVIIHLEGFSGGLARAQELRAGLLATRAAGKKVLCYVEGADFRSYYVAAACGKIALHPSGMIDISGKAAELAYFHGTLEKIGVQVESARVGPYKGAPEPFLQDAPSKETLEVSNALLDAAFGMTVEGIASGRGLEAAKVRSLVDGGYYPPPQAKEQKLVDYVCYPDELEKTAADYIGAATCRISDYGAQAPASPDWGTPPEIAVVYATGAIATGESKSTPLTGEATLGSDTLVHALKDAGNDYSVRAIVLRVDSPGGDGFASDEVWHEIERVKKKKPVVVSMGNVAASGGYYISQGANEIFANPGTVTGSIGVFLLKPNFAKLYEKVDYKVYLLSRGALSETFTTSRPWTAEEKDAAARLIDVFYRDFITKAAAGRKTTPEAIDAVGRGHVWIGEKAKELKLVDTMGGLEEAVAKAKELAHIPAKRRIGWVTLPKQSNGVFDALTDGNGDVPDDVKAELRALPLGETLATMELLQSFGSGPVSWSPDAAVWSAAPPVAGHAKVLEERRRLFWPF
jgi:protease-4